MIDYFIDEKMSNAINIPISDSALIKKMLPFYNLSEKMGKMVYQLTDSPIKNVEISCFGHAEDSKSICLIFLKGLLSKITDSRINMINANIVSEERGINYSHTFKTDKISYLNLIHSKVITENNTIEISGSVFSESHLRIVNIMGFDIDLDPSGVMLFIKNNDVPGVVGKIGTMLGEMNINIAGYLLSRIEGNDFAYAVIKVDSKIENDSIEKIRNFPEVIEIMQLII